MNEDSVTFDDESPDDEVCDPDALDELALSNP